MAAITESTQIARTPEDVFAYAIDFVHFPEWQGGIVSVSCEADVSPTVGSRAVITRRVGPRRLTAPEEITELNPPRTWSVRAADGRVKARARGIVEPLRDGRGSRVTISLDFEGRGLGRLLVPLVIRRQAHKQLPRNLRMLKERLERSA